MYKCVDVCFACKYVVYIFWNGWMLPCCYGSDIYICTFTHKRIEHRAKKNDDMKTKRLLFVEVNQGNNHLIYKIGDETSFPMMLSTFLGWALITTIITRTSVCVCLYIVILNKIDPKDREVVFYVLALRGEIKGIKKIIIESKKKLNLHASSIRRRRTKLNKNVWRLFYLTIWRQKKGDKRTNVFFHIVLTYIFSASFS